jgi:CBS domain-containing membrane protein
MHTTEVGACRQADRASLPEEDRVRVRELMSTPVTTLDPNDSLAFAEELMNVERVRHLPVVDGDTLVGVLSHRDILAASISSLKNPSQEEDLESKRKVRVREVMRGSVETIGLDELAMKAADVLLVHKVGCLPVVDERHKLMGIVTESDFVLLVREALASGRLRPPSPIVRVRSTPEPQASDAEVQVPEESFAQPTERRRVAKTRSTMPTTGEARETKADGGSMKHGRTSRRSERAGSRSKR